MGDYRFNKPWAADSQNVQDFTEEQWGTGIVEKSLVSSSQVNGVLQDVTSRFLELEAVEDRQYRYDFVVDDEVSWQNFVSGNIGNAYSVLIRGNFTADSVSINLIHSIIITLEEGVAINIDAINISGGESFCAYFRGGQIQSSQAGLTLSSTTSLFFSGVKFSQKIFSVTSGYVMIMNSSCYFNNGSSNGGYFDSMIMSGNNPMAGVRLKDCKILDKTSYTDSTLIRCTILPNTKLTNCTLIDCDYTVNTYTANLVTGTTFRNCNVTIAAPQTTAGAITTSDCVFRNCKLTINSWAYQHTQGSAYDCEFAGGDNSLGLKNKLSIFGNSYMIIITSSTTSVFESIAYNMRYSQILTDVPFYRSGSIDNYYNYTSTTTLIPGVICRIADNSTRSIFSNSYVNNHFLQYLGDLTNQSTVYGNDDKLTYIHTAKFTSTDGYVKITI